MTRKIAEFRNRLAAAQPIIGTFVKTPSPVLMEVLGLTELDVCCLDAEHAPFGRMEIDGCVAVLRFADMPSLVRVPDDSEREIRNALDAGATGILVPHVTSRQQAEKIAKAAHFGEGGRGYAGSTRAAGFTTKAMPDHLADSAEQTVVIAQIEDQAALPDLEEIFSAEGVDAFFVGRIDLAVSMGLSAADPEVIKVVEDICRKAREMGKIIGMFVPAVAEVPKWRSLGATFFLLGSDQSFIHSGASALVSAFNAESGN